MKKLLTVLLSVLMVLTLGVINVAADDGVVSSVEEIVLPVEEEVEEPVIVDVVEDPVDGAEKIGEHTAVIGIIYAEGVDDDGNPTGCEKQFGTISQKVDLEGLGYYILADVLANTSDPDGYEFLMFGKDYNSSKKTVKPWTLTNARGKLVRSWLETEDCYAVYVKKGSVPEPVGDFEAHFQIVYSDEGWGGASAIAYGCHLGPKVTAKVSLNGDYYYLNESIPGKLVDSEGKPFVALSGYELNSYACYTQWWDSTTETVSIWATLEPFTSKPWRSKWETKKCYILYTKKGAQPLTIDPLATAYEAEFDGKAHNLVNPAPECADGVIKYSLDGGKTWNENVPQGTNAGEYSFLYRAFPVEGDTPHTPSAVYSVFAVIDKKTVADMKVTPEDPKANLDSKAEMNIDKTIYPDCLDLEYFINKIGDGDRNFKPLATDENGNFELEPGTYVIKVSDKNGNCEDQYKTIVIGEEGETPTDAYTLEQLDKAYAGETFKMVCSRTDVAPKSVTIVVNGVKKTVKFQDVKEPYGLAKILYTGLAEGEYEISFHYADGMHVDGVVKVEKKATPKPTPTPVEEDEPVKVVVPYTPVKTGVR